MSFDNEASYVLRDKAALAAVYDRQMNVYEWQNIRKNGFTEESKVLKYEAVPCGVGYVSAGLSATVSAGLTNDGEVPQADLIIKVFCDEVYDIKPGSVLTIKGMDGEFTRSGLARKYADHQELTAIRRVD